MYCCMEERLGFGWLRSERSVVVVDGAQLVVAGKRAATATVEGPVRRHGLTAAFRVGRSSPFWARDEAQLERVLCALHERAQEHPLATWMADNAGLADRPWTAVVLPATHDSAAYEMDASHPLPRAWWSAALVATPHLRGFVAQWACTQGASLYEQLLLGVRALDLRVARHPRTGLLWLVHNVSLVPLRWALLELRRFLVQHPSELVVVLLKSGWEHRATMTEQALVQLGHGASSTTFLWRFLLNASTQRVLVRAACACDTR